MKTREYSPLKAYKNKTTKGYKPNKIIHSQQP